MKKWTYFAALLVTATLLNSSAQADIPIPGSSAPASLYVAQGRVIPAIRVPGGWKPAVLPHERYTPPGPHRCGQTITVTPPVPGTQYTLECPTTGQD